MLRRAWVLALMLIFTSQFLWAQHQKVGTTVFEFLKIGQGARPMGMAGAFTAVADDANSLFWNPGGLCRIPVPLLTSTYRNYVAGIKGGYLAYARPHSETLSLAVGVSYLDFGTIQKRGPNNEDLGTFHPAALVPTLGFGLLLTEDIAVGVGVKGIYEAIDTLASFGAAIDVGGTYQAKVEGLKLGAAVQNLGVQLQAFNEEKESLPITMKVGASYQPVEVLTLGLDIVKPVDNEVNFRMGSEWRPVEMFALRAGYYSTGSDLKTGEEGDVLGGFSFGLGAGWKTYSLDYAITPMVALGIAHRVSLSANL